MKELIERRRALSMKELIKRRRALSGKIRVMSKLEPVSLPLQPWA